MCSQSTPSGLAKPAPRGISGIPGQAEDETAPARQHRTADRLAEKAGERRVFISGRQALFSAERSIFLRVAEGRSGRNADARSLCAQRNTPVGRVALLVTPPPMNPAFTRTLSLPTLSTRTSEHQWGRRQGQEVSHAERAERELATGVADLLSAGHSPHPLACSAGPFLPIMRSRRPASVCGSSPRASSTALRRYALRKPLCDQLACSSVFLAHFLSRKSTQGIKTPSP